MSGYWETTAGGGGHIPAFVGGLLSLFPPLLQICEHAHVNPPVPNSIGFNHPTPNPPLH